MAITFCETNGRILLTRWPCTRTGSGMGLKSRDCACWSKVSRSWPESASSLRGDFQLHPGGELELGLAVGAQVGTLAAPGVLDHVPAVAGHVGFVDQNDADGAFARRLLIFISPAAVVGERLALEEFGVVGGRLVDEHEQNFSADVGVLEIVPLVFGSLNAIADEDDVGINVVGLVLGFIHGDDVVAQLEFLGLARLQEIDAGGGFGD